MLKLFVIIFSIFIKINSYAEVPVIVISAGKKAQLKSSVGSDVQLIDSQIIEEKESILESKNIVKIDIMS